MRKLFMIPTCVALLFGLGWTWREVAFAEQDAVSAKTVMPDEVAMQPYGDHGTTTGKIGYYITGETPASSKFVTCRFTLDPGKTAHAPHTHVEEEVMIVVTGHGEIFCDGKTTKVGPGSVMYTTPNAPHGLTNTSPEPLTVYIVKWASKGAK